MPRKIVSATSIGKMLIDDIDNSLSTSEKEPKITEIPKASKIRIRQYLYRT